MHQLISYCIKKHNFSIYAKWYDIRHAHSFMADMSFISLECSMHNPVDAFDPIECTRNKTQRESQYIYYKSRILYLQIPRFTQEIYT